MVKNSKEQGNKMVIKRDRFASVVPDLPCEQTKELGHLAVVIVATHGIKV